MPIRKPVFDPPFNVVRASHVELAVRDLARVPRLLCGLPRLSGQRRGARSALPAGGRGAQPPFDRAARGARSPQRQTLGFKVASEEDLDRAAAWFRRRNLPTAFPEVPYQGRTLRTADVTGMPLEFYFRMDQGERMLQRYAAYQGARIQRIDHINCFTPDVQASYDFYTELGFRLTEYTETDDTRDPQALGGVAAPQGQRPRPRLHQRPRAAAAPYRRLDGGPARHPAPLRRDGDLGLSANMERGPGRHGISNAFFLYIRDPDGHRIELFTSDYLTVDPDLEPLRWSLTDPQRQTLWGHPAPKSWFEEGSEFSSVPVREPVLEARPIVAR